MMHAETTVALAHLAPQEKTRSGIAYRSFGEGPQLVLLHGNVGSWTHWTRNIGVLSRTHRVITPDLPGFGESTDISRDMPIDGYLDLVEGAVVEICGKNERLAIGGFSFGGAIAGGLASRLDHRLNKLALLTPSGFEKPEGRTLSIPKRAQFFSDKNGQREFTTQVLLAIMLANKESVDDEAIAIQESNTARARFDGRQISWSARMLGFLQKVTCPVLLMFGDKDPFPYPSIRARIDACSSVHEKLRSAIIPGAGHWLQYEAAKTVNSILIDFFDGRADLHLVSKRGD